jgi:arylsulfatase A-like enzyme
MTLTRRGFMKMTTAALAFSALPRLNAMSARNGKVRRPNILMIMADDMGYSDAGCYGGDVRTPNLDELAAHGLRFTQHYSTGRCWPSRACVLSGHYAQQIRRDSLDGIKIENRPAWANLLPKMIKPAGYKSYHSGKWHVDGTPIEGGFDRSWGRHMHGCDWDRFFDSEPWKEDDIEAPVKDGRDYYSTTAIADHALACLKLHGRDCPGEPFFQYIAFYSPHFPLHAIQEDIDSYRDAYIEGWDVIRQRRWQRMQDMGIINCPLSQRQPDIFPDWNLSPEELEQRIGKGEVPKAVAWDTLTPVQKQFQAGKMAIHAAMITRMDHEIGRVIKQLKDMGEYENTLILFASDNGASAEQIIRGDGHDKTAPMGSAESYLCLGPGWSTAANTPFRLHKHWNHEGGISSPLIVHWPAGIRSRGELRTDPTHFIDIVPTVLEAAGCETAPAQSESVPPRPGLSLLPAFKRSGTVKHDHLWWAHQGNRAIRRGSWKLSARSMPGGKTGEWELYDLSVDRCEMNNLADKFPEKVKELAEIWQKTADGFHKYL